MRRRIFYIRKGMGEIAEKEEKRQIVFNQTPDRTFTEQIKQLKNLQAEYERLGRSAQLYRVRVREGNREIEYTSMAYAEMEKREKKLVQEVKERAAQEKAAREAVDTQKKETPQQAEAAVPAGDPAKTDADTAGKKNAAVEIGKTLTNVIGVLFRALRKVGELMKSVFSSALKLVTKLGKGFLTLAKKMNVFNGLSKAVGPALKKTGEIMKKVFLQTPLEKGLELLRTKTLELAKSDVSLNGVLEGLKSALVSAFMPIYQAALPPLTALLGALTRITQAVGRFIAALFGGTGKQAQGSSKALEEETKALQGTGAAAEEAAGSLAAFDEINTIETEDKAGRGGGGGGSAGESGSAETTELLPDKAAFLSWGEAFSALLDEILDSGLPRLREGFERFAGWFNGFSQKLYGMFTFEGVRDKVQRIGRELAAAFNELTAGIDWNTFGAAIGAGLDLAVVLAVNAIYGYDWKNLGASLAEWLDGAVSSINWRSVGQLLWSGFKITFDFLTGLLMNLDMEQLGISAKTMILEFFQSMQETIASIDWRQIGQQIKTFLVNMDWPGIVYAAAMAFGEAFGAAVIVLEEILGEQWQKVVDWWRDKCHDEDGKFVWEGFLEGIRNAVSNVAGWIKEHVLEPFSAAFREAFGIHSPSTVMAELGGYLMDGLLGGILDRFAPVLESVKTVLNGILQFVTGVFTGDWDRAWQGVSGIFRGVWNGIVSVLEGAVNLVISGVNWMISQLNKLHIDFPDWLGGGSFGFNLPPISGVSLPRLAQGAVIPPNREFLAVLGDQKSGYNYEVPDEKLRRLIREETAGLTGGRPAEVKIYLDRKLLGSVLIDEINDRTIQAGRSVLKI